ncbi:hypothetical protein R9X47_22660 [Wukongibacter baidiensis]|uniref:hypothetical protein n=1 Tax=Wukongibacter baidiensis TaxID=1723361 RepID=UPI003D7FDD50
MYSPKILVIIILAFFTIFTVSNSNQDDLNNVVSEGSISDVNSELELSTDDNKISVSVFGEKEILINEDRFGDDIYGTGQLDNRWNLNEIDDILNLIKGDWKINEYIGFVDSSIYYPELFDYSDNIEDSVRNNLIENYNENVKSAKNNVPNISFSVKKYNKEDTNSNYINVNGNYLSPISIILSLERMDDNYPVFVDRTTISTDFKVEYPIIYIKFFIEYNEDELETRYEPATLVLTNDNKFYILIDGAFYSVVKK